MKKIYIDPGHSISDPGAVGYEVERDLNEKVSAFQKEHLLANYDCEVKVGDISVNSVNKVVAEANAWGADFLCSNHFNAGNGDGYEALVYSQKRVELGKIFEKYVKEAGQNSRGVKIRPDLGVLRLSNMPAILNEGAFVDNLKDIQDWNEEGELKMLGVAYAEATAEFLKLEKKVAKENKLKTEYSLEQFVRQVQSAIGAEIDGVAGPETISKTITVSRYKNDTHPVVAPVQKRLASLGYSEVGEVDGEAGKLFEAAVKHFQADNDCAVDGELTAGHKTWKRLLGV